VSPGLTERGNGRAGEGGQGCHTAKDSGATGLVSGRRAAGGSR
jgi:hypothetical protein